MFSPINRVAYDVEAARVGQRTDYDKLILDVTTNGSIEPKDAIARGRRDPDPPAGDLHRPREDRGLRRVEPPARTERRQRRAVARRRDGELPDRGARARRSLVQLPQARRHRDDRRPRDEVGDELAAIPNFGKKSIEEVKETLPSTGSSSAAHLNGARRRRDRRASRTLRQEARPRLGAPQGALLEPCRCADRARADQDDRHEGEGGQADRRADDHARPARRPARPPAGDGVPALARRRAQAVRRGRPALQGRPGGYYADHQDRPAAGRRGRDGLPRARRRRVRRDAARGADAGPPPCRSRQPKRRRRPRTRPSRSPRRPPTSRRSRRTRGRADEPAAEAATAEADEPWPTTSPRSTTEPGSAQRTGSRVSQLLRRRRRRARRRPRSPRRRRRRRPSDLRKLGVEEPPADPREPEELEADDDDRRHDRGVVVRRSGTAACAGSRRGTCRRR